MSRRFLVPLIVGSVGLAVGLTPALAEASTAGQGAAAHPTSSASGTIRSSAASAGSAASSTNSTGVRTVRAPANRSHRTQQPAVAAVTDPNPGLAVEFDGAGVGALSISFTATVTGYDTATSSGLSATVDWGDGATTDYSDLDPSLSFSHEYASTGTYSITLTVSDGEGDAATNTWDGLQTEGSEFTAYPPTRVLDTRKGIGAHAAPVPAGGTIKLQVGNPPIPESDGISAVVLNVTATQASSGGYLTVYGDDDIGGSPADRPTTSNLNFVAGATVANLVIVPVGSDGLVDFYNGSAGTLGVVADVEGYFSLTEVNKFVNIAPTRVLDTRKGIGTGVVKQIPAQGNITITVAGTGKAIPVGQTGAVALNLTAVNGTGPGNITAYPAGQSQPATSNLNYDAGQTVANTAFVPVGSNGQIVLHNNSAGPVDLVADATGYFTSAQVAGGSAYVPFSPPNRELDTRPYGQPDDVPTSFVPGYDASATSVIYNATVTQPTSSGYLSLYPFDPNDPNALPTTSNLNYAKGETVANLAIVPIGTVPDTTFDPPQYEIGIYLQGSGSGQVILDLSGFFDDK